MVGVVFACKTGKYPKKTTEFLGKAIAAEKAAKSQAIQDGYDYQSNNASLSPDDDDENYNDSVDGSDNDSNDYSGSASGSENNDKDDYTKFNDKDCYNTHVC